MLFRHFFFSFLHSFSLLKSTKRCNVFSLHRLRAVKRTRATDASDSFSRCSFYFFFFVLIIAYKEKIVKVESFEPLQAERVCHDKEGGKGHRERGEHGRKRDAERIKRACGDGNAEGIIDERPEEILADVAQSGAAEAER